MAHLMGVFALEQRENAIREDIATAFLDTLAGVVESLSQPQTNAGAIREVLVSAAGFKPALRNQGVAYCCIGQRIISATDTSANSSGAETDALLDMFIGEQRSLAIESTIKQVMPELEKFLIAKSYRGLDGETFQLAAAFDLNQSYQAQRATRRNAIILDLVFSALAAIAAYLLVRAALRPIERLTETLADPGSSAVPNNQLAGEQTEIGRLQRVLNDRVADQVRREALQDLERNRARDAVLARLAASVAHEVRNPLAGMSAAVSTLKRFGADENVRADTADLLERGLASIDRVAAGMLSSYRQEDGERDLTIEDIVDLELLARPKMQRKQIAFEFRSELDTPYPASANPIRQIILNLLLNAAEAAPEGGHVSFLATLNEGALQIVVTDDGPGMPEEALSVVTQAQENDVPQSGRLGLWLIHKLLDDIDARIEINTKSGKGTTVSISVPPRQQDIEA